MGPFLRRGLVGLVPDEGEHFFQGGPVAYDVHILPRGLDEPGNDDRPCLGVGPEPEGLSHSVGKVVHALPDVLLGVLEPLQLPDGIGGPVGLDANQGGVVPHPQAVHLHGV